MINIISNINTENINQSLANLLGREIKNINYLDINKNLKKYNKLNQINIILINFSEIQTNYLSQILKTINNSKSLNIIFSLNFETNIIEGLNYLNDYENKINIINRNFIKRPENFYFFKIENLINIFNNQSFSYKRWFLIKNPFSIEFEIFLSQKIFEIYKVIGGKRIKAIFVDLDDTLWGGTLSEVGENNLNIGQLNPVGETFKNFQALIKNFSKTGIILGIISRNYEKVAINAIKKNVEMILKVEDFAGWKINHLNKSDNIIDLCKELNLLPESVLFIDNSSYEINEARSKIPSLNTLCLGDNVFEFNALLKKRMDLMYTKLSDEDLMRKKNYQDLLQIKKNKKNYKNHYDWLKDLNMSAKIEKFNKKYLERYFQMYNKINQINLSSRRLLKQQINKENQTKGGQYFYTLQIEDKMTNLGIIGLIKLKISKNILVVEDFLFSCRALGRDLEKFFLNFIIEKHLNNKIKKIKFNFKQTVKNQLCKDILNDLKINKKNNFTISRIRVNKDIQNYHTRLLSKLEFNNEN